MITLLLSSLLTTEVHPEDLTGNRISLGSGKLPTHPTPNPCFSLTCDLRAETLGRGVEGGQFPRNLN